MPAYDAQYRFSLLCNVGSRRCTLCQDDRNFHLVIQWNKTKTPNFSRIYMTIYDVCGACGNFSEISYRVLDNKEEIKAIAKMLGKFTSVYKAADAKNSVYIKEHLFHKKLYSKVLHFPQSDNLCTKCKGTYSSERLHKFALSPIDSPLDASLVTITAASCTLCGYVSSVFKMESSFTSLNSDKSLVAYPPTATILNNKSVTDVLSGEVYKGLVIPKLKTPETKTVSYPQVNTTAASAVEPDIVEFSI